MPPRHINQMVSPTSTPRHTFVRRGEIHDTKQQLELIKSSTLGQGLGQRDELIDLDEVLADEDHKGCA
jgi:hypothetical protein